MKRRRILLVVAVLLTASTASFAFTWNDEETDDDWQNRWKEPSELKRNRRSTKDGFGSCLIWSAAHLKSFDNRVASFGCDCPQTLVQEESDKFSIAYQPPVGCLALSCSLKLFISVGGARYELISNGKDAAITVLKDKEPIKRMSDIQLDLLLSYIGKWTVIKLPKFNVQIKWNKKNTLQINAPAELKQKTVGLCGTWDDDATNDWQDINFQNHELTNFVTSWVDTSITGVLSGACNKSVNTKSPCDDDKYQGSEQLAYCGQMNQLAFDPCFESFDRSRAFIKACEWEYCAHKKKGSCQTLANFAAECRNRDITVSNSWRRPEFCYFNCTKGYVHDVCGPETHVQCSTNLAEHTKASTCVEGCFCPPGLVEHNNACIEVAKCTCKLNGLEYQPGQEAPQRCYTCKCVNGKWVCPDITCFVTAVVHGDPHYVTFDKKYYDFMGVHKYYLMKTKNMSIEAQHYKCAGEHSHVTCTKELTVRYDGLVVDLKQKLVILINGQEVSHNRLPVNVGRVQVKLVSSAMVMVELKDIKILVKWNGVYNLEVHIPDDFKESQGLLGNSNGNANDDFMTPEGDIESNPHAFGEKWRVIDKSIVADPVEVEPMKPYIDQCQVDRAKKAEAERLCNTLRTGIFKQCDSVVESKNHYENCLVDICAFKDPKEYFCSALNAYAMECARSNIKFDWRSEVKECALKCPPGQTNQVCGDSCARSCNDINLNGRCQTICVDGCNCPPGKTLDKNGDCILVTECPCVHQGREYPAGSKNLKGSGSQAEICVCGSGVWVCSKASISDRRNSEQFPNTTSLCDQGMEYTDCQPDQPRACQDVGAEKNLMRTVFCKPGCTCKEGYIFDTISKKCFEEKNCPCHHADKLYNDGDVTKQDCKECTCNKGKWKCDDTECMGTCKIYGASHFETFDRRSFDFNGLCTYILVQSQISPIESFKISFTNNICGPEGVPCSRSLTMDIGAGESLESIVLSKSVTPKSTKRILVKDSGQFFIVDVTDLQLSVRWDKINEVTVSLNQKWRELVSGMCGNFNSKDGDDFKTPTSGDLAETSAKVFGDSWKINPQCTDDLVPKDNCAEHPERKEWATEKCKVLHTSFKDCHGVVPVENHYKMCIGDSCGCESGDDCHCLCSAIASYAQKCNENNIPINWRTQNICPMQCDTPGTFYSPCVSTCPVENCDTLLQLHDPNTNSKVCKKNVCVEGCSQYECSNGQVFKSKKELVCVPKTKCKPVCLKIGNITYHEGDMMEYDDCHSCFCTRHQRKCVGKPCQDPTPSTITHPPCPEGYTWRDCLYKCSTLCHSMKSVLLAEGFCTDPSECTPGCGKNGVDCAKEGLRWRSADQCVEVSDCTCASTNGAIVKPNSIYEEGSCKKCECHENKYKCEGECPEEINQSCQEWSQWFNQNSLENAKTEKETKSTEELKEIGFCTKGQITDIECVTAANGTPFDKTGDPNVQCSLSLGLVCDNTKLKIAKNCMDYKIRYFCTCKDFLETTTQVAIVDISTPNTLITANPFSPPRSCSKDSLMPLLREDNVSLLDAAFTASSTLDVQNEPYMAKSEDNFWRPLLQDGKQYWQVDLGQKFPVYAFKLLGDKNTQQYVTSYEILHSDNGVTFSQLKDVNGAPKIFHGVLSTRKDHISEMPVPFEARYVRIVPKAWKNMIAMQVEIYSCFELSNEVPPNIPVNDERACRKPMGLSDGRLHASQITVTSVLNGDQVKYGSERARLNGLSAWRPVETKAAYLMIDFLDSRELTGIATQGDVGSNSWVRGYNLLYSQDRVNWNPILDKNQKPKLFLANYDANSIARKEFDRPVVTRYLKIVPKIYQTGIALRIEVYGCFKPYPLEEVPPPSPASALPPGCAACPDVYKEEASECTTCPAGLFSDGTTCVAKDDCPCVVDDQKYAVGSRFLLKDCSDCICRKGGVSQCQAFACPPCKNPNHQNEQTSKCKCICKPCPQGFRICPTSRVCVREEQWCDGIEHCADDEIDCKKPPKPECPAVPNCDIGWTAQKIKTTLPTGATCPKYVCLEGPKTLICSVAGGLLSTFDGSNIDATLCDHVIVEQQGLWSVSATEDCGSKNGLCNFYVIVKIGKNEVQINQDFSIKYRGQKYSREQVELLQRKNREFSVALTGKLISISWLDQSVILSISTHKIIRIEASSSIADKLRGLCGTPNRVPNDDLLKPNGLQANSSVDFTSSWKIPSSVTTCTPPLCSKDQTELSHNICTNIPRQIVDLNDCNLKLDQVTHSCVQETCQCLQIKQEKECRCDAANFFVSLCLEQKRADLDFSEWRIKANCPADCPANEVYHDCFLHNCERNCLNTKQTCTIGTICRTGCFCKDGYVRKGNSCVLPSECDDCVCAGFSGEQSLGYDNKKIVINNHGSYLASGADGANGQRLFDVIVTKCKCDDQPGSACTQAVTVVYQNHVINMRWTNEKILTTVNGLRVDEFPFNQQWVKIESNTNRRIALVLLEQNVRVSFRHKSRTFTISAPSHTLGGKMEGLCGKCMISDTQVTTTTTVDSQWRIANTTIEIVGDVCEAFEITNCKSDINLKDDPCNIINDVGIFGQCHEVFDPKPFVETCRQQSCRDSNGVVCTIAEAYADTCRNLGLCMDWRSKSFCPHQECPKGFEYKSCGSGCCSTCAIKGKNQCKFPKTEGCFCPSGKVLRGTVCVPENECKVCDDEGHYIGSTWNSSKCETCTCEKNGDKPVLKCDTVKCNELVCAVGEELIMAQEDKDVCCPKQACSASRECESQQKPQCQQDQELRSTNVNNCTDFVCSCVPKKQCKPIEKTIKQLQEGMELTIDTSGCCPREKLVCNPKNCKQLECAPLETEIVKGTEANCCPTQHCAPPKDTCFYVPKYLTGFTPQIHDVGSTWMDGVCLTCRCTLSKTQEAEIECTRECPGPVDSTDYVLKEVIDENACCPRFIRTECKDGQTVYQVSSEWKSEADPCKEYKCLKQNGVVEKKLVNPCVTFCGNGQQFVPPTPGQCCGMCQDENCEHDGAFKDVGAVWKSNNGCTSFTCNRKTNGRAEVTSTKTFCPELKCPTEQQQLSEDGCCLVCPPTTVCVSRVSSENTVGLFSVNDPQHGICKNTQPVGNFTECVGNCETKTRYISGKDVSDCNCCRVDSFMEISVMLICDDKASYNKNFKVPQTCKCMGCGNSLKETSLENFKKPIKAN